MKWVEIDPADTLFTWQSTTVAHPPLTVTIYSHKLDPESRILTIDSETGDFYAPITHWDLRALVKGMQKAEGL